MGIDHDRRGISTGRHRLFLRLLLAGLGLVGVQVAHSAEWRDGGGWKVPPMAAGPDGIFQVLPEPNSPNNQHVTTCTSSSCTRTGGVPAPIGRGSPRLSPSATFPKAAIAAGAIGLAGRALPWLAAGKALYDWYQAAGVRPQDDGDGFDSLEGGQVTTSSYYCYDGINNGCYKPFPEGRFVEESAALDATAPATLTYYGSTVTKCGTPTIGQTSTGYKDWRQSYCYSSGAVASTNTYRIRKVSEVACQSSGTVLGYPLGGLCPQGQWQPATEQSAQTKLEGAPITAETLSRSLEEVLKAGGVISDTGTHTVSGPSSVPGETTTKTTTAANGTTQVTTVTNNYNYNYNGNVVTVTTTTVTQNPDGSTETETSNQPEMDACTANPTSSACTKLGDPAAAELPTNTKTVSFTPVSFSANQSCPGPVQFNALGRQLEFSYAPMCDTISTWVRALVLAGCAFIAAFVFIGGLKA